jgi:hypothetical protein
LESKFEICTWLMNIFSSQILNYIFYFCYSYLCSSLSYKFENLQFVGFGALASSMHTSIRSLWTFFLPVQIQSCSCQNNYLDFRYMFWSYPKGFKIQRGLIQNKNCMMKLSLHVHKSHI